jgi:ribose 5-phosphate isomerase B
MKVLLASDHAGFLLKETLVEYVSSLGYEVEDMGAYSLDEDDDYPDIIAPAAKLVSEDPMNTRAIILGGSGQGEAMMANRFPNVRAAVFNGQYPPEDGRDIPNKIVISRQHNNANVLSLGARFLDEKEAKEAVKTWLETLFPCEERHVRRLKRIEEITENIHNEE